MSDNMGWEVISGGKRYWFPVPRLELKNMVLEGQVKYHRLHTAPDYKATFHGSN